MNSTPHSSPASNGRTPTRTARSGLLILGGGFAGASVARFVGRHGATIVSPENFMLYTPLLPDVAAGTVEPRHIVMPLRQMCPHADLILGSAVALDQDTQTVQVETDTGVIEVGYEQLVIASGSHTRTFDVPGLAERGVGFKTIEEAVHLRNTVLHRLDQADAADEADVSRYLSFVFVGGGYAGVEAVAQLHELAQHALRYYPRLRDVPQRWLLVDAAPRILAAVPGRLGEYAARQLAKRRIEIHSQTHLVSAEDGWITLSDGTELQAETLVWSAGVQASPVGAAFGLPVDERGRIIVDGRLRTQGHERIFALGDCAAVPNVATQGACDPPTCQHALRQAKTLARNLTATRRGRPQRLYSYRTRGQMAILGRHTAIAEVLGIPLRGLPAWLLARNYHVIHLPLRRRRIRVRADWVVAELFPWDITQLGSLGHTRPLDLLPGPARRPTITATPTRSHS